MSNDEVKNLKNKIIELESQLSDKQDEILKYQKELIKFSHNLDLVLSSAQKDTELLKSLQKRLVPTELPQIPGFEVSRKFVYGSKVGGDYFDIFSQKDKMKFGCLLSSASNYSLSAYFLSVILDQAKLLEGSTAHSVSDVVSELAKTIERSNLPNEVLDVLYAQFDRRSMTVKVCCVGNIKGFIQTEDGAIKIITSETPSIKVGQIYDYNEIEIDLEPKMKLCFCSTGLSENLGVDGIADVVQETQGQDVHELRNRLLVEAQLKSGLEMPLRDQTVIVIEIKDNVLMLKK